MFLILTFQFETVAFFYKYTPLFYDAAGNRDSVENVECTKIKI